MNRTVKYFAILAGVAASLSAAVSCTEMQPLEMQVNGAEKDYDAVRAFKATAHPLSVTGLSSWRADGAMDTYLSALPDSLDMVIVEAGYSELSHAQETDLGSVRGTKGTKVIISVDFETMASEYEEAVFQAEMDGEDKAFEAASENDPDGEPTDEEIEAAVAEEMKKVEDEYTERFASAADNAVAAVGRYAYDGILIKTGELPDEFYRSGVAAAVEKFSGAAGLLLLEGNIEYFLESFDRFDYLISTVVAQDRLSAYQEEYDRLSRNENFDPAKYLVYLSLEESDCETPYPDVISSLPLTDPKYKTLALWNPAGGQPAGGLAVRCAASDAFDGYGILRKTIQYLQLK